MQKNTKMIDLHVHTNASDGEFPPDVVVSLAVENGLEAIAITDHDTLSGIQKAREANSTNGNRLEIVPGIELSCCEDRNLHILGYYIDVDHPQLNAVLTSRMKKRFSLFVHLFRKLKKEGIVIEQDDINDSSGRPRFRNIAVLLEKRGIVESWQEACEKYLYNDRYVNLNCLNIPAGDAIMLIKQAGGLAFAAHPFFWATQDIAAEMKQLVSLGLDGIECYHSSYNQTQQEFLLKLAVDLNLLVSGGSDFHGSNKPGVTIGTGKGNLAIHIRILHHIKKKLGKTER